MDITKVNEVESVREIVEEKLGDKGLNLLINNAAALKMQGFPDITEENLLLHFSTNTVGPVLVVKELLPLLQKAAAQKSGGMNASRAAVLNISAKIGSITDLTNAQPKISMQAMGYRISKAALNMAMRVISLTIKDQGILIVSMCPGWVKTDMGSDRALLTVEDSVSAMLKTLAQLNEEHHGTFMDRNGELYEF